MRSYCKLTLRILLAIFLIMSNAQGQRPEPVKTMIQGETMYTLLKPGDIPAIFNPQFIDINTADNFYYPNEPLIAVVGDNEIHAYSTWHLDQHEIVNDSIDGVAIAATW